MFQKYEKMVTPKKLRKKVRLDKLCKKVKETNDEIIKNIISGKDKRFLIVCGPCGADNSDAVLEYCLRLKELSLKVKDKIFLVARLYTAKARTIGEGYLGMMFQPDGDKIDIALGVEKTRRMLANCVSKTGLPIADEFLYVEQLEYNADLISYYFIGARQSDSPLYRDLASGLEVAVGLKNSISGNLKNLAGGLHAIKTKRKFCFDGGQVTTAGNEFSHVVLRGFSNENGEYFSNANQQSIDRIKEYAKELNTNCDFVMVDCSHANSQKKAENQIQNAINDVSNTNARGIMLESYLYAGSAQNTYGVSRVDECLGWEETEKTILKIYEILPNLT